MRLKHSQDAKPTSVLRVPSAHKTLSAILIRPLSLTGLRMSKKELQ